GQRLSSSNAFRSNSHGNDMSRSALLLIILALVLIGGAVYLASSAREVPTTRMEQDVTNEALAH
ncbi:MAG TPA: hypothetical protein VI381_01285, partial [Allosphingosinicella sp.]